LLSIIDDGPTPRMLELTTYLNCIHYFQLFALHVPYLDGIVFPIIFVSRGKQNLHVHV